MIHTTYFGEQLWRALRIAQLRVEHSGAKRALQLALHDEENGYDFDELKRRVHTIARELEEITRNDNQ